MKSKAEPQVGLCCPWPLGWLDCRTRSPPAEELRRRQLWVAFLIDCGRDYPGSPEACDSAVLVELATKGDAESHRNSAVKTCTSRGKTSEARAGTPGLGIGYQFGDVASAPSQAPRHRTGEHVASSFKPPTAAGGRQTGRKGGEGGGSPARGESGAEPDGERCRASAPPGPGRRPLCPREPSEPRRGPDALPALGVSQPRGLRRTGRGGCIGPSDVGAEAGNPAPAGT